MQIKDEASTLVKVVSTEDNRTENTTEFDASVTEMNSTDRLSTSIVDENGISISITETNLTAQYKSVLAVRYAMHECYI